MGRGGGGRSGGGRSGGGRGGGGRSSGGRSSARSSGGRSGGAHRGGYSGGRGGAVRSGGRRSGAHFHNPHYGPIRTGRRVAYRGGAFYNALQIVLCLAVIAAFFAGIIAICFKGSSSSGITKSTVRRKKLDAQYVTETGWYTDKLGWIESGAKLTAGMRSFYDKTGVQPYLYITDTVNGTTSPSDEDIEACAQALYEELFSDEGHILLLFYEYNEDSNYKTWYVCGAAAKTVMDDEACDILLDYVDHYYFSNLKDDEMFSTVFEKAGARIMSVSVPTALVATIAPIALGVLLAVVITGIVRWTDRLKWRAIEKAEEMEEMERALNAGTGSVEDPALKELEEKYRDDKS